MALIPALINAPGLDAVVQNFLVNAPASEISHHRPVVRGGRRQEQVLGFFLPSNRCKGRRRDSGPADNGFHCLQKRAALDFDEVVQCTVTADPTGEPAPFAIGNTQAVVFPGAVDVAGNVDKLLRLAGLQIGKQIYFPRFFDHVLVIKRHKKYSPLHIAVN